VLFTRRTLLLALAPTAAFVLAAWVRPLFWLGLLGDLALLLALTLDLLRTIPGDGLEVSRSLGEPDSSGARMATLAVGETRQVEVTVRSRRSWASEIEVRDDPPQGLEWNSRTGSLSLPPGGTARFTYGVKPLSRGLYQFGDLELREMGRLGLIRRQWRVLASIGVRVHPNISETRRYDSVTLRGYLREAGARPSRLLGGGREFSSLREYLPDDELRTVDWKATARRGKLIARQYDRERNCLVLILLDCGRLMGVRASGLSKLDHAINSALVLAHVALTLGDRVGLLAFDDTTRSYVAPGRGREQLQLLLRGVQALQPVTTNSSFVEAHLQVEARLRRRGLLVCFTDLTDEETAASATWVCWLGATRECALWWATRR
jgi:uncharacterized protein (DUF58 family)